MNSLPLDAEYACMIAFANEKGYSDEVKRHLVDIIAIMELGGILKRAPKEQHWRDLLQQNVFGEVEESDSDFFAQLAVYVELIHNVDPEDWGDYDVIEYAVGLVERGRENLAHKLGIELQPVQAMTAENRQSVLTSINAGQLNQLWGRVGDRWRLAFGESESYDQSESSIIRGLGEFATGSLFSLGLGHKTIEAVQDMNTVLSTDSLEQAARHLVVDVVDRDTITYDAERHTAVAMVSRKLGNLTLRTFQRPVDVDVSSPESQKISKDYREQAWAELQARKDELVIFPNAHAMQDAMEHPETKRYGTDPVTGEDLIAYRGGNGRWCMTEKIAIESFEKNLARLMKAPEKTNRQELKADIETATKELSALCRRGKVTQDEVRELRKARRKMSKEDWLHEVDGLIEALKLKPNFNS